MEYDWDSQALFGDRIIDPYPVFDYPFGLHEFQPQELLTSDCPENFEATSADFDQLEGLYRPFHPIFRQTIVTDSPTVPQDPEMETEKLKSLQSLSAQPPAVRVAKPNKIRKNQQIRVVQHVTEDGLQSDTWAWRKYGQKPIKGSPYPRSYYKCSSLKGCLARKQVERSCSDPNIFIITYTAEHSHSEPTRRSSLAGSKRNKAKANVQLERRLSTETLPSPAMEQENKEVHDLQGGQKLEDTIVISNELVQSLEDLESLLMDQTFIDISPELWPIEDFATFMDGNS